MLRESAAPPATIQFVQAHGVTWVSVERPTQAETSELARRFGLRPGDFEMALGRGRPSGFIHRGTYDAIAVQIPMPAMPRNPTNSAATSVSVFVGSDYVVTVHAGDVRPMIRLFRDLETDEHELDLAFAGGVSNVLLLIVQRLIDAIASARNRLEHDISLREEAAMGRVSVSLDGFAGLARLRRETRAQRRIVAPLPGLIRDIVGLSSLTVDEESWGELARRADRLVQDAEDDLAAVDGLFLSAALSEQSKATTYTRTAAVVVAAALPVLVVAALLGMALTNPLTDQANGFSIGLAVAGCVFLMALLVMKRHHLL